MSYVEPDESGYTPHPSEIDPKKFAVCPSDATQDLVFRSIKAISPRVLQPAGNVPERRTPSGVRPAIFIAYNASKTAVLFEVVLPTNQTVRAHVPLDSWRMSTCNPENVRAAVQKAYLFLLQGKDEPVVVRPTLQSLGLVPLSPVPSDFAPQRSKSHGSRHTTTNYFMGASPAPAAQQQYYHHHSKPHRDSYRSYSSDSTGQTGYSLMHSSAPASPAAASPVYYSDPYRSGSYAMHYVSSGGSGGGVVPTGVRPGSKLKKRSLW